jgi:hypothetical protein
MKRFKELISLLLSLQILGIFSVLTLIFHGLILTKVIPYEIAWGGRLKSTQEMVIFETVSIVINALILIAITARIRFLKQSEEPMIFRMIFGITSLLFLINTLGNLYAITDLERFIFTPLTAIATILSFRSALTNH